MLLLTWDKQGTVRCLLRACLCVCLPKAGKGALNFTRKRIRNVEHPRAGRGRGGEREMGSGQGLWSHRFCIIPRRYLHTHLFSDSCESCDRSALSLLLTLLPLPPPLLLLLSLPPPLLTLPLPLLTLLRNRNAGRDKFRFATTCRQMGALWQGAGRQWRSNVVRKGGTKRGMLPSELRQLVTNSRQLKNQFT